MKARILTRPLGNSVYHAGFLALGMLVAAGAAAPAKADIASRDQNFCRAIGLEPSGQADCMRDLLNATSAQQHRDQQGKWVSRSALATRFWSGSLYNPPIDGNRLNGMPATVYQGKAAFVSNQTIAAVHRALRDAGLYAGPYAR